MSGTNASKPKKLKLVREGCCPSCGAEGCALPPFLWLVGRGRFSVCYCTRHCSEFVRLLSAQGADWGSAQDTRDVRFYYASKRGFHGF